MSGYHPSNDTVATALEMANRAPSLHNSQPWQWRVGTHSVHLYSQPALQLPHADPDGRELLISCGAALHHCAIAFAALGWRAVVHRFPNPAQPDHLASVELHRSSPSDAEIAMAAAIQRRRTDRRSYGATEVRLSDIALMGARAARLGVTLRRVEPTTEFRGLLAQAASAHAADPEYVSELSSWTGRHASDDGVPARNVPAPDRNAVIPGRRFAEPRLATPYRSAPHEDSGVLMALGTTTDDAVARLRAGEATSAVLLTATAQGMASCLVSEPLEVPETRERLREWAFDDRECPQMLIRAGWLPAGSGELPPTPRRPLAETATRLDGASLGKFQ